MASTATKHYISSSNHDNTQPRQFVQTISAPNIMNNQFKYIPQQEQSQRQINKIISAASNLASTTILERAFLLNTDKVKTLFSSVTPIDFETKRLTVSLNELQKNNVNLVDTENRFLWEKFSNKDSLSEVFYDRLVIQFNSELYPSTDFTLTYSYNDFFNKTFDDVSDDSFNGSSVITSASTSTNSTKHKITFEDLLKHGHINKVSMLQSIQTQHTKNDTKKCLDSQSPSATQLHYLINISENKPLNGSAYRVNSQYDGSDTHAQPYQEPSPEQPIQEHSPTPHTDYTPQSLFFSILSNMRVSKVYRQIGIRSSILPQWSMSKQISFNKNYKYSTPLETVLEDINCDNRFTNIISRQTYDKTYDVASIFFDYTYDAILDSCFDTNVQQNLYLSTSNVLLQHLISLLVYISDAVSLNDTFDELVLNNIMKLFTRDKTLLQDYSVNFVSNDNVNEFVNKGSMLVMPFDDTQVVIAAHRTLVYLIGDHLYITMPDGKLLKYTFEVDTPNDYLVVFDAYVDRRCLVSQNVCSSICADDGGSRTGSQTHQAQTQKLNIRLINLLTYISLAQNNRLIDTSVLPFDNVNSIIQTFTSLIQKGLSSYSNVPFEITYTGYVPLSTIIDDFVKDTHVGNCLLTAGSQHTPPHVIVNSNKIVFTCCLFKNNNNYSYDVFVKGNIFDIVNTNKSIRTLYQIYNKYKLIPFTHVNNNQFATTASLNVSSQDLKRLGVSSLDQCVCDLVWQNKRWRIANVIYAHGVASRPYVNVSTSIVSTSNVSTSNTPQQDTSLLKAINTHVMMIQRATMLFDAHDNTSLLSSVSDNHQTYSLTPLRQHYEDMMYKSFDLPTLNIISQMTHKLKQHISQYIIEKTLPTVELNDGVKQSSTNNKLIDNKPLNMLYIPTSSTQIKNIYRFTNVKHCYILYTNSQRKLVSDILSTTSKKCNLNDLIAMYPRRIHNDNIPSRNFVDVSELSSITEKNVQNTNVMLNGRPVSATEMFNEKFMTSALNDSLQIYGVKYNFDDNMCQGFDVEDKRRKDAYIEDNCDDIINQLQLLPNYINKSIDVIYFEAINETIRSVDELYMFSMLIDKVLTQNGKVIFSTTEFDNVFEHVVDEYGVRGLGIGGGSSNDSHRDNILNASMLEKRLKVLPFVMQLKNNSQNEHMFDEDSQKVLRENSFNEFISIDSKASLVNDSMKDKGLKNYNLNLSVKRTLNVKTIKRYMLDGFKMSLFSTPLTEEAFASSITTNPLYSKLNVVEDYLKCCRTYVFERV